VSFLKQACAYGFGSDIVIFEKLFEVFFWFFLSDLGIIEKMPINRENLENQDGVE